MSTIGEKHASRANLDRHVIVCDCGWEGPGAGWHRMHVEDEIEKVVRARVAAEIEAARIVCPIHGIPDCSPPLNGCSLVGHLAAQRATDARIARGVTEELSSTAGVSARI